MPPSSDDRVDPLAIEHLGRDEEIFPLAPVLLDDCFDGLVSVPLVPSLQLMLAVIM